MARMEILDLNFLNTTTQVKVDSATDTVEFAFDRNIGVTYDTIDFTSDTSTIFSVEFETATVITTIILQNHNLKQFRIFFNSVTANTFSFDINETTNSATSTYATFNSQTVNSVQLQMDQTQVGGVEKSFGEFIITERRLQFERNPTFKDYKPVIKRKKIIHNMPDGGVVLYNIADKYIASMKWKFVTDQFVTDLRTEFDRGRAFYFVPFPTTTAWDGQASEVAWVSDFDFRHSENSKTEGQSGSLSIRETSSA